MPDFGPNKANNLNGYIKAQADASHKSQSAVLPSSVVQQARLFQ